MSNTLSHLKRKREEFEKDALELLTCPICFEYLSVPTYQCIKGHILCSPCFKSISSRSQFCCPQCRSNYDPESGINKFLDEMLSFFSCRCKYAEYGCNEDLNLGNRYTHELICSFNRWTHCPEGLFPITNRYFGANFCTWMGPIHDFIKHLQSKHGHKVHESNENKIYINLHHSGANIQFRTDSQPQISWLLKLPSGYLYTNISFSDRSIFIILFTGSKEVKKIELEFRSSNQQNRVFNMSMDSTIKPGSGYQEWCFYMSALAMAEYLGFNSGFLLSIKEE